MTCYKPVILCLSCFKYYLNCSLRQWLFQLAVSCCLRNHQVIRASIVGLGTDEDSLTRAIVTRAEIDMMKIRGEYFNTNKTSLDNAVSGDTSGDYKDFLMTLLGARIWLYSLQSKPLIEFHRCFRKKMLLKYVSLLPELIVCK